MGHLHREITSVPWRCMLLPTPTACDVRHALLRAERRLQSGKARWSTQNRKCDSDDHVVAVHLQVAAVEGVVGVGSRRGSCGRSPCLSRVAVEVDAVGEAHLDAGGIDTHLVYRRARQAPLCVASSVLCEFSEQSYHGRVRPECKIEMHQLRQSRICRRCGANCQSTA